MEEIYIFDIDGCVMPPIILNFNDSHSSKKKEVKEVLKNGQRIKLYPDFVKYYRRNCIRSGTVIFITGRKESEFGKLTESQLKPLNKIKRYQIIFYPEGNTHEPDLYFEWKTKQIKKIIDSLGRKQYYDNSNQKFFRIFDDMDDYFSNIEEFSKNYELIVELFLIMGEKTWNSELN